LHPEPQNRLLQSGRICGKINTGLVAFVMAYINEKKADGSILPGWAVHACANIVASVFVLFSVL
jgi:hypothetical protein